MRGIVYVEFQMTPLLEMLYSSMLNSNGTVLIISAKKRTGTSQLLPVSEYLLSSIYH